VLQGLERAGALGASGRVAETNPDRNAYFGEQHAE